MREGVEGCPEASEEVQKDWNEPPEATRGTETDLSPHDQTEIEGRGVNEQSLENVCVTAKMGASHAAGLVQMREGTLEHLAAPTLQPLASLAANSSTIRIDPRLPRDVVLPLPSPAIRLGEVRPQALLLQLHERPIAVVTLVADDLRQAFGVEPVMVHRGPDLVELLVGFLQRALDCFRVSRVRSLHGHRHEAP